MWWHSVCVHGVVGSDRPSLTFSVLTVSPSSKRKRCRFPEISRDLPMLQVLVAALALNAPLSKSHTVSRRQAVGSASAFFALSVATPAAHAEMYGDGKAAAGQGEQARAIKFAKAGDETEAFKKAEAKRAEAASRYASGQKPKEETAEEAMARLGLRTYGDAVASGFDECATWRGCSRK